MQIELFHGPVTNSQSIIYARTDRPDASGEWTLTGVIRGPFNRHAATLPATLKMTDAGPGDTLLAKGHVPDPCGWSMDLPSQYNVELQLLRDGNEVAEEWSGTMGFRDLGVVKQSFLLNGERWVIRGRSNGAGDLDVDGFRKQRLVAVVDDPNEDCLQVACEQGVHLLVRTADASSVQRYVARPAVAAVVLTELTLEGNEVDSANLPVGVFLNSAQVAEGADTSGFDFLCVPDGEVSTIMASPAGKGCPVVAVAKEGSDRSDCDALQRRLAPANLAGYVVGW